MIHRRYLLVEISLCILAASCVCQQGVDNSDPVEKFWKQKEAIVSSALNGITMDDRQFLDACIFLSRLPGLRFAGMAPILVGCPMSTPGRTLRAFRNGISITKASCAGTRRRKWSSCAMVLNELIM